MRWVLLVAWCGCAEKKGPPLDVALAKGSARAGKVTRPSELIGGPVASPVIHTLLWSAGIVAVFAPLAVRAYRRRA